MAKPANQIETKILKLSTTEKVVEALENLVDTGFYGKNPAEAAERLLSQQLARIEGIEPRSP